MQILLRNGNMKFKLCPPSSQLQTIFYSLNKLEKRGRDSRGLGGGGGGRLLQVQKPNFFHQKLLCSAKKKDFVSFDFVV